MNWEEEYSEKTMSVEDAIKTYIHSGDTVYIGAWISEPLVHEMVRAAKAGEIGNLSVYGTSPFGDTGLDDPELTPEMLRYYSFFYMIWDRAIEKAGNGVYTPMQYGQFEEYMSYVSPDVAIYRMTPPDAYGYCNMGPVGYNRSALKSAKKILVQISPELPRVKSVSHDIHVSQIDAFVQAPTPRRFLTDPPGTETDQKIADILIDRIPDGACIQLGIGAMANAVGYGLKSRKHLGIHTEMFTSCMVDLIECGAVDNSRKTYMPGVSVAGFIQSTTRNDAFVNGNPGILFAPFNELLDVNIIASNDHFVSINSAISVDITGQVCAESIGRRQYSGTGGQLDFIRGAIRSKGGQSFIAFSSEAKTKDGPKSRIVLNLEPGSIVTTPRTEVQYMATEYGCVDLRFQDICTRAKRMISIAHPKYREEFTWQAKKYGYIY